MAGFQKVVLIIALVIFSISILFIAAMIANNNSKKKWPPETASCPPYFEVVDVKKDGKIVGKRCEQLKNSTGDAIPIAYPNDASGVACNVYPSGTETLSSKTNKQKCDWATKCNIVWDGITQKNRSCDKASSV